jgi:hypothetical protein
VAASLDELLHIAARTLSGASAAHALIGGCARNIYAPPRATRDVDVAVRASTDNYAYIARELQAQGFGRVTETRTDPQAPVPDVALFSDATGGRIDLLIAHTDFEERAITRAAAMHFPAAGITFPVVRVEDLIIYKALAARPRDLVDIEDIIRFQAVVGAAIDWTYIENECAQWDALDVLKGPRERARLP